VALPRKRKLICPAIHLKQTKGQHIATYKNIKCDVPKSEFYETDVAEKVVIFRLAFQDEFLKVPGGAP
jgi:hypothetical protein